MKASDLFPQGHAVGEAFCNRAHERTRLKNSFNNHEHTVIVAPRRYGKSSLIKQVLLDAGIVGMRIDLLPATNALFVQKAVKTCVRKMINEIAPRTRQARQKLAEAIKKLRPRLTISVLGQKLEISANYTPENSIIDLLIGLDAAAKKVRKRMVVCFDEFQQVGLLKNYHSIESSIRHAVESSTHVTYVFSGSNRHLLSQMFSSQDRALYHLCDLIELPRIEENTYLSILQQRAEKKWKCKILSSDVLEILSLTKCHSYYVNALCRRLWKSDEKLSNHLIQQEWMNFIQSQSNWITDDLARLTPNQRNIMAALAFQPISEPYGNEFTSRVKIGASSIKKSMGTLMKNDLVYKEKNGNYRVLDPAVETYLNNIDYFDFTY